MAEKIVFHGRKTKNKRVFLAYSKEEQKYSIILKRLKKPDEVITQKDSNSHAYTEVLRNKLVVTYFNLSKEAFEMLICCYHDLKKDTKVEKTTSKPFEKQYIYKKDKTGKRVCEGDILKNEYGGIGYIVFDTETASFKIKYWDDDTLYYIDNGDIEKSEIIGNIYEQPELIYQEEEE